MKLKTSAIALAVAGVIAAPMAAQADIGAYASIRAGLVNVDNGDGADSSIDFASASRGSRIGFKGETDLGNGMTAYGKYEWGVNAGSGGSGVGSTRHGIVGLKGDFGSLTIGHQWHTYYDNINAVVDIANWNSGYYSVGRTSDAVSYKGEFGAVSVGATGYFRNDATYDTGLDGTELSVAFDAGPVRLGVGVKSDAGAVAADDLDVTGISVSGTFSDVYLALSLQNWDLNGAEADSTEISAAFGQFYFIYASLSPDAGPEPTDMTLGYTLPIGRQTTSWFEYVTSDADDGSDDDTSLEYIIKYSWD
ncbi:MAG: porin [Gammaproteobacteria bacterium]|nr:porin [Gammaproteobacteria bacterium]MDH3534202.1 porin [Gammaproteobacteria bacterium]